MADLADDSELADWALLQPTEITGDPLWRLDAYRHAAYLLTLARDDAQKLVNDPLRSAVAAQLLSAAGSIAANIAEGYGRPTTPDRVRYFSYALGSTRETATWYEAVQGGIPESERKSRLVRLARIRRILLGLLTRLREKARKPFDRW